jgi:hypothetical protein
VIGVNGIRRAGMLAVASLALAAPAAAQSPDPDAAPGPSPDPAPAHKQAPPKTATQPAAPQTTPTPANESPPVSGVAKTTTRHTTAPRRKHRAKHHQAAPKRALPALPHIRPAQLLASPSNGDARARRLAIGAVALLLLALASATLIAVTARVERRRMLR